MKKLLSLALVMAMFLGLGVTAFAEDMPTAYPDPDVVYPGSVVRIYTEDFYWEDDDGNWVPLDCELDKEYFSGVTPRWKKGKDYIERVYFDDGDDYVTIIIRDDIAVSSEKEIYGTLRIRDTDARRNYECEIEEGDLTLAPYEKSNMEYLGDREFTLPWDYQSNEVKFVTEDGDDYGTFTAEFDDDRGHDIAYFVTKIVDQSPLYLGFNQNEVEEIAEEYPRADLRFITWPAWPTFDIEGDLGIYMDPDEFIYGIDEDGELYRLGGSYDTSTGAYVIETATLGSYVISDRQLISGSGSGSASSSGSSSSVPPASSSQAPASSSSTPPASSSSVAPPASSSSSSESSEASSESSSEEVSPAPPSSSSEVEPSEPESEPADTEVEEESGGFPLVPVLIGVLVVVIVVCVAVVVIGNRGSSSKSRKKKFDDWDD